MRNYELEKRRLNLELEDSSTDHPLQAVVAVRQARSILDCLKYTDLGVTVNLLASSRNACMSSSSFKECATSDFDVQDFSFWGKV